MKKASLPVVDLDDLFCWQNMEYCLLTLNSEVWEDFYVSWQEDKLGHKVAIKTGDKELDKLEEMIADGDNFADKLESFFLKYNDEIEDN